MRNKAHADALQAGFIDSVPAWQRLFAKPMAKRVSRPQKREQNKGFVTVVLPAAGGHGPVTVDIARPLCSTDDLVVRLHDKTIEHIVRIIVDEGFDDELKRAARDPALPKGVLKRGSKFLVVQNGTSKKYKYVDSIDAAVRMAAIGAACETAQPIDGETHVSASPDEGDSGDESDVGEDAVARGSGEIGF